ncbi:glycosyltransferase [Nocardioides pacificus]
MILPTWNRAATLHTAVESVQAQSFERWELIVVDDGSTDDTMAVLRGITAFDSRVVAVASEHAGVSHARNVGLSHARGTYVAFLDSDNTWRPDFLRVMLGRLEAEGWGMAHAALRLHRRDGVVYRAFQGTRAHLLARNHVDLNVLVARRDLVLEVGGFDETLRRAVDYDLVLKLAARTDLHLVDYVGAEYSDDTGAEDRISVREPSTWISVALSRHLLDWEQTAELHPGRTSVVLPVRTTMRLTAEWIRALGRHPGSTPERDLELVVVANRLRRAHHVIVSQLSMLFDGVRVVPLAADVGAAAALDVGLTACTGEYAVLVRGGVAPDRDSVLSLTEALAESGATFAQPVLLDAAGSILCAGAVFGPDNARPEPFLAAHPLSDAVRLGRRTIPAPLGPVLAVRTEVAVRHHGLDPLFGEALPELALALTAGAAAGRAPTVLEPTATFTVRSGAYAAPADLATSLGIVDERWPDSPGASSQMWEAAGFEVVGHRYDAVPASGQPTLPGPLDRVMLTPRTVIRVPRAQVREQPPRLRWAIDLASPAGPPGERWGDTHFARALAQALEARGQQVAIDAREARHRPTRDLDDVVLVLRGLDRVHPRPGALNLEWVISHPDLVDAEEAAAFDLVYAASLSWAAEVSASWGVPVAPLLQCTDPALFHPGRGEQESGPAVLFVGNSRGVFRTSLRVARAAGADVTIYGGGWAQFLPDPTSIKATHVDNREVGGLYASAGVVLNDHWEDMRRFGFISNRLFDAAACGARVVSDEIAGLEVFGGLVQTFTGEDDMARLLAERDQRFPDAAERIRIAAQIAAEHSFDHRAETLLEDAVRALARRTGSR